MHDSTLDTDILIVGAGPVGHSSSPTSVLAEVCAFA